MRIHRLNGSFLFLIFLSSIAIAVIFSVVIKVAPLLASKTLYFCQQFVSNTLFQIPHIVPNTVVIIIGAAFMLGSLSFLVQLIKTQRLLKGLLARRVNLPRNAVKLVASHGLKDKVFLVDNVRLLSFCTGVFSKRIIITTGLVSSLTNKELEAVFLHEKAHLNHHDPLKMLVGKAISCMFFFLPIFLDLHYNIAANSELLADHNVIKKQHGTFYLRGALKKILAIPQVSLAPVPAIANAEYLEIRIHRLINPKAEYRFRFSRASIVTGILFVLISWFVLQTPANAFHIEDSLEPSYFMCSSDNDCRQECSHNVSTNPVISPEQLFSPMGRKFIQR